MNSNNPNISCTDFFQQQLAGWPEATERFRNLEETCRSKELPYEYSCLKAQFNPARVQSAKAKTDKQSIKRRSCFLCDDNRPKEQMYQNICKGYQLLVNPFPILPVHFTIVAETHRPQEILPAFSSYQMLLNRLSPYIVFYNGPSCGASAPDHMHFQAGSKGYVPIEARWETDYEPYLEYLYPKTTARGPHAPTPHYGIFLLLNYPTPVFVLRIHKDIDASPLFRVVYQALEKFSDTLPQTEELLDQEPMMNLLGWQKEGGEQIILIFPRSKHRPEVYYREDDQQMSVSPGAIDMGGLLIAISEQDYDRLTPEKASEILSEVGISREQSDLITEYITGKAPALPQSEPEIQVGILSQEEVTFVLNEPYQCNGQRVTGEQTVSCRNGELLWNGQSYPRLCLTPEGEGNFTLPAVTIGINFHWQQKEAQTFQGGIVLKAHEGLVVLINRVKAETYLSSVICSEMNSESPYEFLKASAIISRSWVLSQILQKKQKTSATGVCGFSSEEEIIRWYEQSEHKLFDVCADDHCQRYQGISRITSERSRNARTGNTGRGAALQSRNLRRTILEMLWRSHGRIPLLLGRPSGALSCSTRRHRPVAGCRPESGSGRRRMDIPKPGMFLQHQRPGTARTDSEPLRPKHYGLLPLDGSLPSGAASGTAAGSHRHRFRTGNRYRSHRTGTGRPYFTHPDCRNKMLENHRQGTRDTPSVCQDPFIQCRLHHRERSGSRRCTEGIHPARRRLGTRCGHVPDRSCCDGQERI